MGRELSIRMGTRSRVKDRTTTSALRLSDRPVAKAAENRIGRYCHTLERERGGVARQFSLPHPGADERDPAGRGVSDLTSSGRPFDISNWPMSSDAGASTPIRFLKPHSIHPLTERSEL